MAATKTETMRRPLTLNDRYMRLRSSYWRWQRLLFPSAAEVKFVRLMGGKVWPLGLRSWHTKGELSVVWLGRTLRHYKFRREVRCGRYYMDFANDIGWALEVDGRQWHMNVVADMDREIYLNMRGWRLLRVPAPRLWNDPGRVYRDVLKYITQ